MWKKLIKLRSRFPREWLRLSILMAIAAIAMAAGIAFFMRIVRLPVTPPPVPRADGSAFNLTRLDGEQRSAILRDQALLLDPAPLFLPTPYNASQSDLGPVVHRDPGDVFRMFPARYAYPEDTFAISFADPVPRLDAPVDVLAYGNSQNPYAVLGRFERPESALPARMGIVEVVKTSTGQIVRTLPLSLPVTQETTPSAIASGDWKPMELLASVDASGLVGIPALLQSSGSDAVDGFLKNYLVKQLHIGERLSPGFYTLRVGP